MREEIDNVDSRRISDYAGGGIVRNSSGIGIDNWVDID